MTMDIYTPLGSKVKFTYPNNGYQFDQNHAQKYLKEGEVYTVSDVDVGSWSSRVTFLEVPGKWFNTVLFENLEKMNDNTTPSGATAIAHEIWAAAQLAPGEGIVDGVARVEALLSRYGIPAGAALEEAALTDVKNAHFDLWQNDMVVASASGPREQALAEIQHYAAQYAKNGPVEIEEIIRIPMAAIAEHGVK